MSFLKKALSHPIKQDVDIFVHQVSLDAGEGEGNHFDFTDQIRVVFHRGDKKSAATEYKQIKLAKNGNGVVEFDEHLTLPVTFFENKDGSILDKSGYLEVEKQVASTGILRRDHGSIGRAELPLAKLFKDSTPHPQGLSFPIHGQKSTKPFGLVSIKFEASNRNDADDSRSEISDVSEIRSVTSETPKKGLFSSIKKGLHIGGNKDNNNDTPRSTNERSLSNDNDVSNALEDNDPSSAEDFNNKNTVKRKSILSKFKDTLHIGGNKDKSENDNDFSKSTHDKESKNDLLSSSINSNLSNKSEKPPASEAISLRKSREMKAEKQQEEPTNSNLNSPNSPNLTLPTISEEVNNNLNVSPANTPHISNNNLNNSANSNSNNNGRRKSILSKVKDTLHIGNKDKSENEDSNNNLNETPKTPKTAKFSSLLSSSNNSNSNNEELEKQCVELRKELEELKNQSQAFRILGQESAQHAEFLEKENEKLKEKLKNAMEKIEKNNKNSNKNEVEDNSGNVSLKTQTEALRLESENFELKNKIIKLENASRLVSIDNNSNIEFLWENDEDHSECMNDLCKAKFSLLKRRHHCRMCGKIYCNNCSKHFIGRPQFKNNFNKSNNGNGRLSNLSENNNSGKSKYRVCEDCFSRCK